MANNRCFWTGKSYFRLLRQNWVPYPFAITVYTIDQNGSHIITPYNYPITLGTFYFIKTLNYVGLFLPILKIFIIFISLFLKLIAIKNISTTVETFKRR